MEAPAILLFVMLISRGTQSIEFSGTEFILAFCEHKNHQSTPVLTIINDNDDSVTVNISTPRFLRVAPVTKVVTDFISFRLPEEVIQIHSSKRSLGIHISSDKEIYVQGFNTAPGSIGGFLVLPLPQLGTEYIVVTHCESYACLFMIVATANDTKVSVHFQIAYEKVSFNNVDYQSNDTLEITLQSFDTLQLQSPGDLSGTCVRATKPVAVYSGSDYTEVDNFKFLKGKDNIIEQMPPISALGTLHVLPTFPDLFGKYQIKAVSISHNNSIDVNGKMHKLEKQKVFLDSCMSNKMSIIKSTYKIILTVLINNFEFYSMKNIDGSLTVIYPEDKRQTLMTLGRTFRFRATAPTGDVAIAYIWYMVVTHESCDIRESSITIKHESSDYRVLIFNYLPSIEVKVDKDLVTLTGCPIYSGTLWMRGNEAACMMPWPGNHRPLKAAATDGQKDMTFCESNYWRLYLLQRGFSVDALFGHVHRFVNQCCAPILN